MIIMNYIRTYCGAPCDWYFALFSLVEPAELVRILDISFISCNRQ